CLVERWDLDEPFLVAFSGNISQLTRVAATERGLASAMQHLAPHVEILIDHEHPQTSVACPDRAGHAGRPRADDHNVRLVVPLDLAVRGLRRGLRDTESGGAGCGDCAAREEISPTEGLVLVVLLLPLFGALPGHVFPSLCRASLFCRVAVQQLSGWTRDRKAVWLFARGVRRQRQSQAGVPSAVDLRPLL